MVIGLHEIYRIDETRGNVKRLLHLSDEIIDLIYKAFPRDDVAWIVARLFVEWSKEMKEHNPSTEVQQQTLLWSGYIDSHEIKRLKSILSHDRSGEVVKLIDSLIDAGTQIDVAGYGRCITTLIVAEKIVMVRDEFKLKMSDARQIYDLLNWHAASWRELDLVIKIFAAWIRQDPSRRPNEMWTRKFLSTYDKQLWSNLATIPSNAKFDDMSFDEIMNKFLSDDVAEKLIVATKSGKYHWVELMNGAARAREAARMVHCGEAIGRMFSLRDIEDEPILTVEVDEDCVVPTLEQVRASSNRRVDGPGHVQAVYMLCNALGVEHVATETGLTKRAYNELKSKIADKRQGAPSQALLGTDEQ